MIHCVLEICVGKIWKIFFRHNFATNLTLQTRLLKVVSMQHILPKYKDKISELCRKFGVVRLEIFGSVARNDFNPDSSDIDLVASFSNTRAPGYADRYLDFAQSLEELLGRKVDLITPRSIRNRHFAEVIKREAIPVYESSTNQET